MEDQPFAVDCDIFVPATLAVQRHCKDLHCAWYFGNNELRHVLDEDSFESHHGKFL